jgi:ribonuclease-3
VIPLRKPDELCSWVERTFGHVFATPALCHTAVTHRSAGAEHNERLEFLGDSILNCAVARLLFDAHPLADEGALSRLRASLVSGDTLAQIAGDLGLGEFLRLGQGELKSVSAERPFWRMRSRRFWAPYSSIRASKRQRRRSRES